MQAMRVTNAATTIVNSGSKSKVKLNVGELLFNVQKPKPKLDIGFNFIV